MREPPHSSLSKASPNSLRVPSFFYGLGFCGACSLILGIINFEFDAPLLALLTLSGALALSDLVDALRGIRDILSARALVSSLMFLTTYITPLMHIGLEANPLFIVLPEDMSKAFFNHAVLQAFCVAVYFICVRVFTARRDEVSEPLGSDMPQRQTLAVRWLLVIGAASLFMFLYTVLSVGGPLAWINLQLSYREGLGNPGWLIALAEAFPTLFFMAYIIRLTSKDLTRKQLVQRLAIALILFIAITFLTSGLRGSRANLVWPTLSAIVIIHLLLYRVKLRFLAILALIGVVFAGLYDIYKKEGVDGVQTVQEQGIDQLSNSSAYSFGFEGVLMNDFSRSAMQAVVLDRWNTAGFTPYYGATYLGDVLLFVPGDYRAYNIPDKSVAATDILYGPGAAKYTDAMSTRIYGLQGEGLMNFGPVGAILVFIPFAYIVTAVDVLSRRAILFQAVFPAILYSVLIPAVMLLYLSDLDNVLRNITSNALLPAVALCLASFEQSRSSTPARSKKRHMMQRNI